LNVSKVFLKIIEQTVCSLGKHLGPSLVSCCAYYINQALVVKVGKPGGKTVERLNRVGLLIGGNSDASRDQLKSFLKKNLMICNLDEHSH
jgi:hypothetical protein